VKVRALHAGESEAQARASFEQLPVLMNLIPDLADKLVTGAWQSAT
jgi:hypothetical protein